MMYFCHVFHKTINFYVILCNTNRNIYKNGVTLIHPFFMLVPGMLISKIQIVDMKVG
jgi:hypothetical protein